MKRKRILVATIFVTLLGVASVSSVRGAAVFTALVSAAADGGLKTWFDSSVGKGSVEAWTESWEEGESRFQLGLGFSFPGRKTKGAPADLTVSLIRESPGDTSWGPATRLVLLADGTELKMREPCFVSSGSRLGLRQTLCGTIDVASAQSFIEAGQASVGWGRHRAPLSSEQRRRLADVLSPEREWNVGGD